MAQCSFHLFSVVLLSLHQLLSSNSDFEAIFIIMMYNGIRISAQYGNPLWRILLKDRALLIFNSDSLDK